MASCELTIRTNRESGKRRRTGLGVGRWNGRRGSVVPLRASSAVRCAPLELWERERRGVAEVHRLFLLQALPLKRLIPA
jgi:hypothetical protein